MKNELRKKSDRQLLRMYADVMTLLRERKVIRTSNNPVADYAEYLVSRKLGLILALPSQKSYDAYKKKSGIKYQIKARRLTRHRQSSQLGLIRSLKKADFDYLLAVIFNEDFSVKHIYKIPKHVIAKYSRFSKYQNGHILSLGSGILDDKSVKELK